MALTKARKTVMAWFDGKKVREVQRPVPTYILRNLEYGIHTLYNHKEYTTICEAELPYWEYFGFKIEKNGIGWKIKLGCY